MEADGPSIKQQIREYCLKRGALAVGFADVEALQRIAPAGHRPRDMFPRTRTVISLGVGGGTQGAMAADAKTLAYIGDTETRAYKIAYGLAFFIESRLGHRSIYVPPDADPQGGARVPMQSMKLHAEVAGIGARSMAGDILLHPEFGMLYYGSVFTELELPPDAPLENNPCPDPSCVRMYERTGQTPCQKFCPVGCLSGSIDGAGEIAEMHYDAYRCAEMSQQYEAIPNIIENAITGEDPIARGAALYGPEVQLIWYKLSIGAGQLLALCYECMRVCPITRDAPQGDPLKRGALARAERGE